MKPGPAIYLGHVAAGRQRVDQRLRQRARVGFRRLRQQHRGVGREVAVGAILRALDHEIGGVAASAGRVPALRKTSMPWATGAGSDFTGIRRKILARHFSRGGCAVAVAQEARTRSAVFSVQEASSVGEWRRDLGDGLVVVSQPGADAAFQFGELAGQFTIAGKGLAQLHERANGSRLHFHGLRPSVHRVR